MLGTIQQGTERGDETETESDEDEAKVSDLVSLSVIAKSQKLCFSITIQSIPLRKPKSHSSLYLYILFVNFINNYIINGE